MCNAYYLCANGIQFEDQFCPEGLLFNGQVCDWPANVDCNNSATTTTTTTTTTTSTEAAESTCADGMYSLDDCTGFYQCAHGHRYPNQYCPGDLLFNGQVCDWPQNVSCGGAPEQSGEPTEAPTAAPTEAPCADGIYRDEAACDQFYQCANGHRFPNQFCPAGLMFNGQVCDWPENVDCGNQSEPEEPEEPESSPEEGEEESYLECVWACKADKPIWQQFSCFTECAEVGGEPSGRVTFL